jgi:lipoprotein
MKKILFFLAITAALVSCSEDKPDPSKAKQGIEETLNKNAPYGSVEIKIGKEVSSEIFTDTNEEFLIYKKLQSEGYIKIEEFEKEVAHNKYINFYSVNVKHYKILLTDKAKDYVLATQESGDGTKIYEIKTYDASLDKIRDLYVYKTLYYSDKENKYVSTEAAEVRGIFLKSKKTPFYDLEKDKTEFFAKEFKLIQIEGEWTIQKEEK